MTDDINKNLIKISDYLHQILPNIGKNPMGLSTGIPALDKKTKGLKSGELYIIGGRPSMGKSALMVDMVLTASEEGAILIFSMEMSAKLLIERMVANLAGVNFSDMQDNLLSNTERKKIEEASNSLLSKEIFICDNAYVNHVYISNIVEAVIVDHKVAICSVFIDYLQLMGFKGLADTRNEEIAAICRNLKNLARYYNIPFVVLSQLNRKVESRDNKRPTMADLRDSGAIEQDADSIMFLYRPGYYTMLSGNKDIIDTGEAEIIIAKQRNGPTGIVHCMFDKAAMSFRDRGNVELGDI